MRILVTGTDGFLGKKLFSFLGNKHETFGVSRKQARDSVFLVDLSDKDKLSRLIEDIKPNVIIHAAALVDVEGCEIDRERAYKINVGCTENIIPLCKRYSIRLVYISTDYVFSGKEANYTSESEKDPLSYYGETKSIGEEKIKLDLEDFIILRPTILYGFNDINDKNNFVLKIVKKLNNNEELVLDNERVKYPLLIDDVARAIEALIAQNKKGVFHLTGSDAVTKEAWGRKIARVFNLSEDKIVGRDLKEPYRPQKVTFDLKKNIIKVLNLEEGIKLVKKQMERTGWK